VTCCEDLFLFARRHADGLLRMKEAMDKTLDEAWRKRAATCRWPIDAKRSLASIVEKETAVPAGGKWRRLHSSHAQMRLSIRRLQPPLGKPSLTRADLASNSPKTLWCRATASRLQLPGVDRGATTARERSPTSYDGRQILSRCASRRALALIQRTPNRPAAAAATATATAKAPSGAPGSPSPQPPPHRATRAAWARP
jgi:UPF0755 protein